MKLTSTQPLGINRQSPGSQHEGALKVFGFRISGFGSRWSLLASAATATLTFLLASSANAQTSQFLFDVNGNLFVQTAETSAPPQILGQPQMQIVATGESAAFSVVVADPQSLTYQWRFNGVNLGSETGVSLVLDNVGANNEGAYDVVLTNPSGSVTSAPAMLWIDSRGVGMPDSWQLAYFGNLTQLPNGDFDSDGSSNLQEFLDGTDPTNVNSVRYRLTVVRDGGAVTRIPDQVSYTNGESVTLTVIAPSNELFHAWLGDAISRDNPITLVMTSNKTVYARFTPIGFTWTNAASSNWEAATNWSPNLVPGTNDSVIIDKGVTVTLNTNADCLDFTLGEVGSPTTPPTLTGSGALTVRGNLFWSAGTMSISGTLLVQGNSSWLAGTMSGGGRTILETNAYLSLGSVSLSARTLENRGTILLTGAAPFDLANGAIITNCAGALFDVRNAVTIGGGNVSARIDNAGTFRKSVSSGTTTVNGSSSSMSFNNYGAVEIQSGTLQCSVPFTNQGAVTLLPGTTNRLAFGGAGGGTFDAPASALVEWSGGSFTLNAGAQLNGAGLYRLNGGTLTANPNLAVENLDLVHTSSTLGGTGVVTIAGAMNWTAGTMSGSGRTLLETNAFLSLSSANSVNLFTRTLENRGTILLTGAAPFNLANGSIITNCAGALFDVRNAVTIGGGNVSARIDNAGTFRKSISSGTTTVNGSSSSMSFNNYGAVEIQSGTLQCGVPFSNYNTVDIRSGILAANSGYVSSSNALLNCSLGGTNAGTGYGQLQVPGSVTLKGALSVDLINGFVPRTNSSFTLVTAGSRNGTFATFSYPSNAATMQLSNTANSVIARVSDVFIVPQPAPLPPGLISWWRAEGNALDSIGTNHGALINGAGFSLGQVGQTFAFDGTDDYVQVLDSPSLRPVSVTIEAWVKFFATNGIRIILVKPLGNNTTFDSYGLALQDGAIIGAICDNGGFGPFLSSAANITPGQWYHVAYTFDDPSQVQALYVNAAQVASGSTGRSMAYDNHAVLLGADLENGVLSFFHNGQIDEASIYNRALTGDEIATIYNAGSMGKQLPGNIPPPLLLTPEISGANLKLTWTSVSNTQYRVEFNPDLFPSNWTALAGDVIAVSNTVSKLDSLTPTNRFYRVRVLP